MGIFSERFDWQDENIPWFEGRKYKSEKVIENLTQGKARDQVDKRRFVIL